MVGILVHGNNHFILSGPAPDEAAALALARHWSIIQIGEAKSSSLGQWEIRSREFRRESGMGGDRPWRPRDFSRSCAIAGRTFRSRRCHSKIEQWLLVTRIEEWICRES